MGSSILKKLEKVLRVAESANVHEAANAAAKAKAIADKYNIIIEILKQRGNKGYHDEIIDYHETYGKAFRYNLFPWELVLSKVIADHSGCRAFLIWVDGNKQLNMAGKSTDIEMVDLMFSWLRLQIFSLILKEEGRSIDWIDAFTLGAIHQVNHRMTEAGEETKKKISSIEGAVAAIVKLDGRLSEVDKFLNSSFFTENVVQASNPEGFFKGFDAARSIIVEKHLTLKDKE